MKIATLKKTVLELFFSRFQVFEVSAFVRSSFISEDQSKWNLTEVWNDIRRSQPKELWD